MARTVDQLLFKTVMGQFICVVPCYNEEAVLPSFFDEMDSIGSELEARYGYSIEYVFVDDGSSDRTLSIIKSQHDSNPTCHYVSFTRNFGKESGLYGGLSTALRYANSEVSLI